MSYIKRIIETEELPEGMTAKVIISDDISIEFKKMYVQLYLQGKEVDNTEAHNDINKIIANKIHKWYLESPNFTELLIKYIVTDRDNYRRFNEYKNKYSVNLLKEIESSYSNDIYYVKYVKELNKDLYLNE